MVRCLSKMMQKPVLGYYSGRRLGSVCGFLLHPETHRLLSVEVKRHKWSAAKVYWMRDISKDSTRMSLLSYTEEGERREKVDEDLYIGFPLCIGRSVRAYAKTRGQIADIWVNWPSGMVAWYEVSKGYLDDMRRGRAYARGYWVKTNQQNWVFQCIQEV